MNQPRTLLKVFGTAFGLAIAIGATIGGGILSTPGDVAARLPVPALFLAVWAFGGLTSFLGATIYAELGTMIPRSGGIYTFVQRAFGDRLGFFMGYADWLNYSLASAGLVLLAGDYVGAGIPALKASPILTGGVILVLLAALQWRGVREGGGAQEVTSALKALSLVALVVAAVVVPHASAAEPAPALPHGWALIVAFGMAMQGVVYTYDSYYAVIYTGEEMVNPGREIPRSIFRGLALITTIYLLINLAFVSVVPMSRMAHNTFVGGLLADALFGASGDRIIRGVMVVSIVGTLNAQLIAASRILHAMSRDGLFPRAGERVNQGGTPHVALALSVLAVGGFLVMGSPNAAFELDSVFIATGYVITFAAFFWLRRREPDAPRPYRARGYPWVQLAALVIILAFLVTVAVGNVWNVLITLGVLLVSWPASHVVRRLIRRQPASY